MSKLNIKKILLPDHISKDQARDTGLAMVLIGLLGGYFGQSSKLIVISILLLIFTMIFPSIFRPLAFIWYGVSSFLGIIMSKLILSLIFIFLVTPVGLVRRMIGLDSLKLKEWKKDSSSVFKVYEHQFKPEDIENPY